MLRILKYLAVLLCVCGLIVSIILWVRGNSGIRDDFSVQLPGTKRGIQRYHLYSDGGRLAAGNMEMTPWPSSTVIVHWSAGDLNWTATKTDPRVVEEIRNATGGLDNFHFSSHDGWYHIGWPAWLNTAVFAAALASLLLFGRRSARRRNPVSSAEDSARHAM